MNDIFGILWDISEALVALGGWAYNFLNSNIDIFGMNFSVWGLLTGVGLTTVFIYRMVRG